MGKSKIKRIAILTITFLILLAIILITRLASEQNGAQSNMESGKIVKYVMDSMIKNGFPVNSNDLFWKLTANVIVRKMAHFLEYMLIGVFLSVLLNLLTKKMWVTLPVSAFICFMLAYLDEYRQQFVDGRGSTWFDVRIDTYGSVAGILIATFFFVIYNKLRQLKAEIRYLNEEQEKVHK